MSKRILLLAVLCGLGTFSELFAFKPAFYFISSRIVKNALHGLNDANGKLKASLKLTKATRGLGKKYLSVGVAGITKVAAPITNQVVQKAIPLSTVPEIVPKVLPLIQNSSKVASNSFKKAIAAGCATVAAGLGYMGSLLSHTQPAASAVVVTPTVFQSGMKGLSQHKMVAGSLAVATVTIAYCVHHRINPVTKVKEYFSSQSR